MIDPTRGILICPPTEEAEQQDPDPDKVKRVIVAHFDPIMLQSYEERERPISPNRGIISFRRLNDKEVLSVLCKPVWSAFTVEDEKLVVFLNQQYHLGLPIPQHYSWMLDFGRIDLIIVQCYKDSSGDIIPATLSLWGTNEMGDTLDDLYRMM